MVIRRIVAGDVAVVCKVELYPGESRGTLKREPGYVHIVCGYIKYREAGV